MMYFKECPKCHGDLFDGEDLHGRYVSCIQCGYMRDLPEEIPHPLAGKSFVIDTPKPAKKRRKKVARAA